MQTCSFCQGTGLVELGGNTQIDSSGIFKEHDIHVSIIGGGIGGCALTLALRQRNIPCTLFEKDENALVRSQGYGLTLQQGYHALASLGIGRPSNLVGDQGYDFGIKSNYHVVLDTMGNILSEWGERTWKKDKAAKIPRKPKRFNVHIPRQELRRLLLAEIPEDAILWGQELSDIRQIETTDLGACSSRIELKFEKNSIQERGRLHMPSAALPTIVVGADGIWSQVRQSMFQGNAADPSPLRYLECFVILGISPTPLSSNDPLLLDNQTIFETVDGVTRLYGMPYSNSSQSGQTMWQLSFPIADEQEAINLGKKGAESLKLEALRRCGSWHAPIPNLLESTSLNLLTGYPVYDRPVPNPIDGSLRPVSLPSNITLIGDAAHPVRKCSIPLN